MKYRRNQPQWHGAHADPNIYCQGNQIGKADTPFGAVSFLICGDLFNDDICNRVKSLKPDLLLFPFARCFSRPGREQERWNQDELPAYRQWIAMVGVPTLMVNYLGAGVAGDNSFGGAFLVTGQGALQASVPLLTEKTLLVDLAV